MPGFRYAWRLYIRGPMTVIAVVGAGFMGGGIAAELALRLPDASAVRVWDAGAGRRRDGP